LNIPRLVQEKISRLLLIATLIPLQSCSNTLIGEKLENSFDSTENSKNSVETTNQLEKLNQKTKIKSRIEKDIKENKNELVNNIKKKSITNVDRLSKESFKPIKKKIFNPKPYRIILRLSGANPSAPAETVTEALRKAGVQFEVEKIERFDKENFSNDKSLIR
tara:strand:- start:74 stop:562 length:489 start_codon:yes stop_codon:yes gene_type:complete